MRHQRGESREEVERPLELSADHGLVRPAFAIIDIGSNSVRMVVYDGIARAPLPRFNEKSFCRLAEGLDETGLLSAEGITRTLRAVRRFKAIADAMRVARVDVLATEATRRATNGADLVAAIARETGFQTRILTGQEEANFATLGVISGFFRPIGLVGDMGGGSLEVAEAMDDRVGDKRSSLPLGALPVSSILQKHGKAAKVEIDRILTDGLPTGLTSPNFYAVGGGWRALAKVYMAQIAAPLRVVHGFEVDAGALRAFAAKLWKTPTTELAILPGLPSRRAETLACSALVMERVIKHLAPQRVVFSALGVREGWLYAQLPTAEQYLDPLVEAAQSWGLPLARVPGFAYALAKWTDLLFPDETLAETRLRVAACAISDIAWRDQDELRAVESFRRVSQFPFIGLDHAERAWLAAVIHARYAGRANDPVLLAGGLDPAALRRARIIGLAFLVAYRFSGSVPEILTTSRLVLAPDKVTLQVDAAARAPDSEALMSRLRLLGKATGVSEVTIEEAG